ncbi:hypothetical protein [Marinobacter salarius]|uniref:hypothetical protein n=1 Tax=Marinobacter salarius TaxID=1420917 RepID=UPI003D0E08D9
MNAHQIQWNDEAEKGLAVAARSPEEMASIKANVKAGKAQLWQMTGLKKETYLVTRVERPPHGERVLVLVVCQGSDADIIIPWCMHLAEDSGIKRLRAHIERDGLVRKFERFGWTKKETVIAHGW